MKWAARLAAMLVLGAFAGACATPPAAGAGDAGGVVGTWRLVRYEDRTEGQPVLYPYGQQPKGRLTYDAAGNMTIQIMAAPHPRVASGSDETITPEEKIALFDAYTAYFGTYRVDEERGVLTVHVEGDIADVFIGKDEVRPFRIEGRRLLLTPEWEADGVHWTGVRMFERMN